ncbi:hypothetical protein [Bacteroides sp. 224]|uniref:hypothetical protein n=1 Tax=Bacteroides sp. 224 TaxID=2302936 RepID=UPI0013D5883B|nr:hypothetical protein [Bacteroides sp. 224]NDV66922.1 hypothetical protein [Bacteroides sp. 224]
MEAKIIYAILIFLMASLHLRLISKYAYIFIGYMFNQENKSYDKHIEKPRLLFHIIAFLFMMLAFIPFKSNHIIDLCNWIDIIKLCSSFLFFSIGTFFLIFSWSNKFKDSFIPKAMSLLEPEKPLSVKTNIGTGAIIEKCIANKHIGESSKSDLELFLTGKSVKNKIVWIDKVGKSQMTNYRSLFAFLDEVIEGGFVAPKYRRRKHYECLLNNFSVENGEYEKNIKSRYSEWYKGLAQTLNKL